MTLYQTAKDGSFLIDGMSIPNSPGNRHYQQMLKEIAEGEAEILPYIAPPLTFEEKNRDLLAQLREIDFKSIRALREGDQVKIDEWEIKAVAIRARFKN